MFIAGAPCETVLSVWTVRCKSVHGNIFFFFLLDVSLFRIFLPGEIL